MPETTPGIRCEQQKQHEVLSDEQLIGTLIPDLIVEDCLIVDSKVITSFNDS